MISYLSEETQLELELLAASYGQPLVRIVDLGTSNYFDPLNRSDRYGEVCMVVQRPNGKLLTMKKTFYPPDGYRLLTGGINHGETILEALLRETREETGLEIEVERFLVAAGYRTVNTGETPSFYTFAFLLKELGGTLGALDEGEQVEAFREIAPDELPTIAQKLEHVENSYSHELHGNWSEWGQFRAAIHWLVWEAWQHKG